MDFNTAVENDLLWITYSCNEYMLLTNILLREQPGYNNPVIHCALNRSVQSYSSRNTNINFQWDLKPCAIIFNLKAVNKYVLNININDLQLLNVFDYKELILNNDIIFVIPEQIKFNFKLLLYQFLFHGEPDKFENIINCIYSYNINSIYLEILTYIKSVSNKDLYSLISNAYISNQSLITNINQILSDIKSNISNFSKMLLYIDSLKDLSFYNSHILNTEKFYQSRISPESLNKCFKPYLTSPTTQKPDLIQLYKELYNQPDEKIKKYYSSEFNNIDSYYKLNLLTKNNNCFYFKYNNRSYNINNTAYYYNYADCYQAPYIKLILSYHTTGAIIKALQQKSTSESTYIEYLLIGTISSEKFGIEDKYIDKHMNDDEKEDYKNYILQYNNKLIFDDFDNLDYHYVYSFKIPKEGRDDIIELLQRYQLNSINIIQYIDCNKCINRYSYKNFFKNVMNHNGDATFVFSKFSYVHRSDFINIIRQIKDFIENPKYEVFEKYILRLIPNKSENIEENIKLCFEEFQKQKSITLISFYNLIFYFSILQNDDIIINPESKKYLIESFQYLFNYNCLHYDEIKKIDKTIFKNINVIYCKQDPCPEITQLFKDWNLITIILLYMNNSRDILPLLNL